MNGMDFRVGDFSTNNEGICRPKPKQESGLTIFSEGRAGGYVKDYVHLNKFMERGKSWI